MGRMRSPTIWLMFLGRVRTGGGSRCTDMPVKLKDNSGSSVMSSEAGSRSVTRLGKLLHGWSVDLWGDGSTQMGNVAALPTRERCAPLHQVGGNRCRWIQWTENDDTVSSLIKRWSVEVKFRRGLGPPRRPAVHLTHSQPYGMKAEKSEMPIKCSVGGIESSGAQ